MTEPTITRESRSSIELHRHKDGTYFWDIKRYQQEGETSEQMLADIEWTDDWLQEHYTDDVKP